MVAMLILANPFRYHDSRAGRGRGKHSFLCPLWISVLACCDSDEMMSIFAQLMLGENNASPTSKWGQSYRGAASAFFRYRCLNVSIAWGNFSSPRARQRSRRRGTRGMTTRRNFARACMYVCKQCISSCVYFTLYARDNRLSFRICLLQR